MRSPRNVMLFGIVLLIVLAYYYMMRPTPPSMQHPVVPQSTSPKTETVSPHNGAQSPPPVAAPVAKPSAKKETHAAPVTVPKVPEKKKHETAANTPKVMQPEAPSSTRHATTPDATAPHVAQKTHTKKRSHDTGVTPTKTPVSHASTPPQSTRRAAHTAPKKSKPDLLVTVGKRTIEVTVPKPIQAPKVTLSVQGNTGSDIHTIKFSKRFPPDYVPLSQRKERAQPSRSSTHIGGVNNGMISAHLRGKFMEPDAAAAALKKAGFTLLSQTALDPQKHLISLVFTDPELIAMASNPGRGFMASLRLLVDRETQQISITNPMYFAKAFMQASFDPTKAKALLRRVTTAFPGLENAKDSSKFQRLPSFQFMSGMPHYQEMATVARGTNLLHRIQKNPNVVFRQKLHNGATLIGIRFTKRTQAFVKKIGTKNAALLPYPILIEKGQAKILDPRYYIAVMYPLLQMSEFMSIAKIPEAIIQESTQLFE